MCRHRPSRGASSIAPLSLMHSAWTPRAAKWRRVISGYLVATRMWLGRRAVLARDPIGGRGDRDVAMPDIQIERRVDLGIVEFHQYVVAGDAELGRAEGDKGRDIEAAHADQIEAGVAGRKAQPARCRVVEGGLRLDAYPAQQRHHLGENPAVGQRQDQAIFAARRRQLIGPSPLRGADATGSAMARRDPWRGTGRGRLRAGSRRRRKIRDGSPPPARPPASRADRQQRQNPVFVAAAEAAIGRAVDRAEGDRAQDPLTPASPGAERSRLSQRKRLATKTKICRSANIGEVAHRTRAHPADRPRTPPDRRRPRRAT